MKPWLQDPDVTLYHGDCLEVLRELPDGSVHMCATSPPFYGLRDYGTDGQIGLEETPDQWVDRLVQVFREVKRVLRDDGTLWVEIGDSYNAGVKGVPNRSVIHDVDNGGWGTEHSHRIDVAGVKPKDLLGQPWLLAFALRADGWYLRSEIIWARPNPMPESVTDRPTKSHSTVFLLSKQPRYFYDADAIRETAKRAGDIPMGAHDRAQDGYTKPGWGNGPVPSMANARSVWQIPTEPTPYAHFATWPQALVRRMILAGTSERGCCPECGAPWVREVESELVDVWKRNKRPTKAADDAQAHAAGVQASRRARDGHVSGHVRQNTTLGWSPSCACDKIGNPGRGDGRHARANTKGGKSAGDIRAALNVGEGTINQHAAPSGTEGLVPSLAPVPCTVLDPFAGSGTTSLVARNHNRHSIGIELNADYLDIAATRLQQLSLLT